MTLAMQNSPIAHFVSDIKDNPWPKRWLWLSVISLALAGIFAIVLVVARTPQLQALATTQDLFQVALVAHVDLSVLVWFLAMTSFLWSLLRARARRKALPYFDVASWWSMAIGMGMIALSPVYPEWETLKSNYIPVITNLIFFIGLSLVLCSVLLGVIHTLIVTPIRSMSMLDRGIYGSVVIALIAIAAFFATPLTLTVPLEGIARFETYFWAGGHILQFTYTQSMLVAWCIIAAILGYQLPAGKLLAAVLLVGPCVALTSVIPYILYESHSQEHMDFFTQQMIQAGGIAGAVLFIYLIAKRRVIATVAPQHRALRGCFIMSLALFAFGGVFGVMIDGPNVRIPAHYHGSIVAVTLALMGLAYGLLPAFADASVLLTRLARIQPYLYGVGQMLHVSGLAWSGGYGVLRKTVGDVGDGSWQVKAALGIMGTGGLLAIIGGLCFVVVMLGAFHKKDRKGLTS